MEYFAEHFQDSVQKKGSDYGSCGEEKPKVAKHANKHKPVVASSTPKADAAVFATGRKVASPVERIHRITRTRHMTTSTPKPTRTSSSPPVLQTTSIPKPLPSTISTSSTTQPVSSATPSQTGLTDTEQAILKAHNDERATHGAKALVYNPDLAAAAQRWADKCVYQHGGAGEYKAVSCVRLEARGI